MNVDDISGAKRYNGIRFTNNIRYCFSAHYLCYIVSRSAVLLGTYLPAPWLMQTTLFCVHRVLLLYVNVCNL